MTLRRIELHALAPPKPEPDAACNGCGVCCALVPCPVAHVFLWQFRGACRALVWQAAGRYACGMVLWPDRHVRLIPARWRGWLGRFFASRIAAGAGCDCAAEVDEA